MSHTSKTTTKVVEEHYDQEGNLFKRVTTETVDEFQDFDETEVDELKVEQDEDEDEEETRPFKPLDFSTLQYPQTPTSPSPKLPTLPDGWKVYCWNGFGCPSHPDTRSGRSAG